MRRWWIVLVLASLFLSGCASYVRNDVIAFHQWPANLPDKSYVFVRSEAQKNNLQHQSYENLVRAELTRLGFNEASTARNTYLKVAMDYRIDARDVTVVEPVIVDPWPYWYGAPYYGPRYRGYYSPFYDPFWDTPAVAYQQRQYQVFKRQLNILITRAKDDTKLYEVTVDGNGGNSSLAFAMLYMVRSAFADFPGRNGVPRRISLEIKDQQ